MFLRGHPTATIFPFDRKQRRETIHSSPHTTFICLQLGMLRAFALKSPTLEHFAVPFRLSMTRFRVLPSLKRTVTSCHNDVAISPTQSHSGQYTSLKAPPTWWESFSAPLLILDKNFRPWASARGKCFWTSGIAASERFFPVGSEYPF